MTSFTNREGLLTKIWPQNPWSQKYLGKNISDNNISKIDWVSGCALFISQKNWITLEGFDERYFLYVEDVDLGRKAAHLRIPVYYAPLVDVVHESRSSAKQQSAWSDAQHHLGSLKYFIKWSSLGEKAMIPFVALGLLCRFTLRRLLGGN